MTELLQNEEFMKWLFDVLPPQVWLVVFALYLLGIALKAIPKCPDWLIPVVLMVAGALLVCAMLGFTATNVVFGLIAGGLSVGGNQLFKQIKHKRLP